jgi:hypothetical protein
MTSDAKIAKLKGWRHRSDLEPMGQTRLSLSGDVANSENDRKDKP